MSAYITQIVNANVYVDGDNLLGRAKEINLADLTAIMNEYKGLGMVGTVEFFAGFEKLEGSATWNSFYPDVFRKFYNVMRVFPVTVRANLQTCGASGIVAEESFTMSTGWTFKKIPVGSFKPQEAAQCPGRGFCEHIYRSK